MTIKSGTKVRVVGNKMVGEHPIGFVGVVGQTSEKSCRVEPMGYTENGWGNWYVYSDLEVVKDNYLKVRVTKDVSGWPVGFVGWHGPEEGVVWNDDFSVRKYHTLGDSCELVEVSSKTWGEMTDAEKGALLLAHHEGKVIECLSITNWYECREVVWDADCAYRVRPEPKRETVTVYGRDVEDCNGWFFGPNKITSDTVAITFELVDGKPDVTTIKMKEL